MLTKAPRGTYDILPQDSIKWQYIESIMKETAEIFGYREIKYLYLNIPSCSSGGRRNY